MKPPKPFRIFLALLILILGALTNPASANPLYKVTNVSPSPLLTNEFYLTATNITTLIDGKSVRALVYQDDPPAGGGAPAQIPGPLIEANVGQTIICHFKNKLTNNIEGATVHWHGIELDNDSDGTGVTQDTILNGQTYTYRFIVTRAGLYWYHSHMLPGTTTFGGMYGPIVVHDTNETALIAANVLPPTNRTFQLMMSDVSFTNGMIGKVIDGTNYSLNTLIQKCENLILGFPGGEDVFGTAGSPGNIFLCNGSVPIRGGPFCATMMDSTPIFYIGKNQRVRLQLFDASISRNCYLTLQYPCSNPTGDTNLYHIGGQGGLLDNAVLDGGVQNGYDFLYDKGNVNLGSGMREDVMFYSSGTNLDVITLLARSRGDPWKLTSEAIVGTNYPVAFFIITNGGSADLPLAAGSPILTAIGASNENLRLQNTNALAAPPLPTYGTQNGLIELQNHIPTNGVRTGPNIGGYAATALDGNSGNGSWPSVPHPPSAVWARAGDVVQLAVANTTDSAHPYHLHGFSMQPVAIYTPDLKTNLFNFPFNQFVDTIDLLPRQALVFRIKLTDRPVLADTATGGPLTLATDSATGGNVGRWLMHCHIFMHGTVGMISELVVLPNTLRHLVGPAAGLDSAVLAGSVNTPWTATANAPWVHVLPGYTSAIDDTNVIFSFDANAGATRVGQLNVGGETVVITQAGSKYVKAPGPLTPLVTNSLFGPYGIVTDGDGNVYFSDSGNGMIKKWDPILNTVSTLVSGLSSPYGLGMDGVGNLYFAQHNNTAIKKWSAANHLVSTVFNNDIADVAGLAVDAAGNIYITVPGENAVKKWTASTGTLAQLITNGLDHPFGVAVDLAGRVYVADTYNSQIKRYDFTPFFSGFFPFWTTIVSSNSLNHPWNLAVDDGGNVYIADGFNNAIKKWNAASNTVETLVSTVISDPTGVAVDSAHNVYISDWDHGAIREVPYAYVDPTPRSETAEATQDTLPLILMPDANLLAPFVPVSSAFWLSYNGASNGILKFGVPGNPAGPRVGTLTVLGQAITISQAGSSSGVGTTNLLVGPAAGSNTVTEFVIPSVNFWSASTVTPWLHLPVTSGSGSANVLFKYDANPGVTRTGKLTINGKAVMVTQAGSTYVQAPGPCTSLVSSGLASSTELTVDLLGNVIFSDSDNNLVKSRSPITGAVASVITNGLNTPEGVAVDAAGNIYVADYLNYAIKMRQASDGSVITLADTWPNVPISVSLDADTNVYWTGPTDHAVKKWTASGGNVSTIVSTNLNLTYALAVDVARDIFVADAGNNTIKKWNPATATLTTVGTGGNGLNSPWGVAVDGSGNVYVANGGNNTIVEWVAASGTFVTRVPAGGLLSPIGVAVDANQNLYMADSGHTAIKELPYVFVDPSPKFEPGTAGSDSLPVVLPLAQSLQPPFAPTSSQPWLTIASTVGGVVSFNFTANTNGPSRTAVLTVLGQDISVTQSGIVHPPALTGVAKGNGVFQIGFTNGTPGATYSILFSTNVTAPLSNWVVLGTASQVVPGLWQFSDTKASDPARFYRVRSP
ncbi:MAG TPA: multicopper oxidase domain-containing protein [Candidatus Dormibacteraeota bacterium]|nr:multicopper oxidase domain-containing protein [Candidatus Dormibacteraeota bacterium]